MKKDSGWQTPVGGFVCVCLLDFIHNGFQRPFYLFIFFLQPWCWCIETDIVLLLPDDLTTMADMWPGGRVTAPLRSWGQGDGRTRWWPVVIKTCKQNYKAWVRVSEGWPLSRPFRVTASCCFYRISVKVKQRFITFPWECLNIEPMLLLFR